MISQQYAEELARQVDELEKENAELRRDLEIWRRNGGDDLMRARIEELEMMNAALEMMNAALCFQVECLIRDNQMGR